MLKFVYSSQKVVIFIGVLLVSASFQSIGQSREFTRSEFPDQPDALRQALTELSYGDFYYDREWPNYARALYHYQQAMVFNPDNARLNYRVGVCCLHMIHKDKAPAYLKRAIELGFDDAGVYYLLGKAFHQNYRFSEAIEQFHHYLSLTDDKGRGKAQRRLEECNNAIELMKNPVDVVVENAGELINSSYDDYRPILSPDGESLYFTSRRLLRENAPTDSKDEKYYENVFVSRKEGGQWLEAIPLEGSVNTAGHESAVGIGPDGRRLFIYRGNRSRDVHVSNRRNQQWSRPGRLPAELRSPGSKETSIVFTTDGRRVFFISDRDGGEGGKDIWTSVVNSNGKWGEPINLGPRVNTPYDEEGLFLAPDNVTLYFSSQGHNSMGGFDVFKTVFRAGMWSEPKNLGYPINTPFDDLFFVMSPSGDEAWYASMRPGGYGGFDIYRLIFSEKPESDSSSGWRGFGETVSTMWLWFSGVK